MQRSNINKVRYHMLVKSLHKGKSVNCLFLEVIFKSGVYRKFFWSFLSNKYYLLIIAKISQKRFSTSKFLKIS